MSTSGAINLLIYVIIIVILIVVLLAVLRWLGVFFLVPAIDVVPTPSSYTESGGTVSHASGFVPFIDDTTSLTFYFSL